MSSFSECYYVCTKNTVFGPQSHPLQNDEDQQGGCREKREAAVLPWNGGG